MILIKLYFDSGDKITTAVNLTLEEAKQYYEGKLLGFGMLGRIEDYKIQRCIKVEEAYTSERTLELH